jgi:putative flippase GtrA
MRAKIEALVPSPFLRFAISGGIAALVNIIARIVLSQVMSYSAAIVIAYLVGMTTAYILMLLFVFSASGSSVANEYLRFGLVNLIALAQVWLVSIGLADWCFPGIGFSWHSHTVAHIVGVLSPIVTSYFGHKSFTFASRSA